jgi:quinol monooxygenase YgiN
MEDQDMNEEAPDLPVSTLIAWQAPRMTPSQARALAEATMDRIGEFPGFVEGRFFGDFETGSHYYLFTWRDRAALDAYAASEHMLGVRELAGPYVEGRPSRELLADYSVR